jgi:hypothetical protein
LTVPIPDPLSRECRSGYPAFHHDGNRQPSSIRYIVLHSTQSGSALSTARYFTTPAAAGSSNLVVDDLRCYRTLADHVIPWGAPPLNTLGFHIEQAGYADWSRWRWLLHRNTIRRCAYKAALRCKWYRIPLKVLTAEQLKVDYGETFEGQHQPGPLHGGVVTHATVSQAFGLSDHHDPGAGYPVDVFAKYLLAFGQKDL